MKTTCQIALKEWDVVVRALRDGRQSILLRKGGISDAGGAFTLKENEFFLFPTWEHQDAELLNERGKKALAESEAEKPEEGILVLDTYAVVESVREVKDARELDLLPEFTVWSPAYIAQRLAYKPEKPLYLVTVKTHRLTIPHMIPVDASYSGCVSWVPLKLPLETA